MQCKSFSHFLDIGIFQIFMFDFNEILTINVISFNNWAQDGTAIKLQSTGTYRSEQTEQSDQGLHCLLVQMHLSETLLHCKENCSIFRKIMVFI